ncbi:hypothetical protein PVAP13_8KG171901 [Panicum virgatum]|uniref:Uncharacterized protein n=1 Tax=Panicum virgatum TaxID=38727 RepID=A0A8T0PL94_PANVG|nr:hypothetical protein PVAP13_8KG171901 [Panicum virgatum]
MNRISFLILSAKSKYSRGGHVIHSIFDSLGGPIDCNLPFIIIQGRVKLSLDLIIPIIAKAHDIIKTHLLALIHSLIKERILHIFVILPIHLTPKMLLKTFTLIIFVDFLLACLPKCHIFLVVISFHLNCKAMNNSRSMKPWNAWIVVLLRRVFNLQARRGTRTNVMSNIPPCWSRTGWRSHGSALHNVMSFPWLLS